MEEALDFDWDDAKAASNLAKHGVPFEYAARIFFDVSKVDLDVSRDTDGEQRRKVVGVIEGRLYVVVYTLREARYRLISARRCNAKEENAYGPLHT